MKIIMYIIILACGALAIRKKPLATPANLLFIYIMMAIILGDILLPISILSDNVACTPSMLDSLNKHFYLSVLAFFMMTVGFFLSRKFQKPWLSVSFFKSIKLAPKRLFIICMVYFIIGTALIFLTFYATGIIPLFNIDPLAVKYFQNNTANYLPYRPFYALAIYIVSFASIFILFLAVNLFRNKQFLKGLLYVCLFLSMSFVILLTAKRGDTIMPLFIMAGVFLLEGTLKLRSFLILTSLMFVGIIVFTFGRGITDSGAKTDEYVVEQAENNLFSGPLSLKLKIIKVSANSLFVEIREGGRLLNAFQEHSLLLGKTYLAGFISLVPTRYSSFKNKYSLGRLSMRMFGSNPDKGGGPQVGYVAESFINFGITGVFIIPFLFGAVLNSLESCYLDLYNSDAKEKMLLMMFIFLILLFFRGFFTDGSGALQPFIVRIILCVPIFCFAITKKNAGNYCDKTLT